MNNEVKAYQNAKKKIELECAAMDLRCTFYCEEKPLRMEIRPFQGVGAQLSLLENLERRGMSPNAKLTMTYDGQVSYEFDQTFTISEAARKKLVKEFVALCVAWRDLLFWQLHEAGEVTIDGLNDLQEWAVNAEDKL